MKRMIAIFLIASALLGAAAHKGIKLPHIDFPMKQGEGMYATRGMCNMCHSWGYVINQGLHSEAFWRKKVHKMINIFHAPIDAKEAEIAVKYLTTYYGLPDSAEKNATVSAQ